MARYERNTTEQGEFLAININEQFDENSREYHIKDFLNRHVDIHSFDKYYNNDETGRKGKYPIDLIAGILYGYVTGNRSGRKIEKLLQNHIGFMYISNRLNADHSKICDFKMLFSKEIEELFARLMFVLNNLGEIDWDIVVGDGTKIKANAGKWRNVGGEITDKKLEIYRKMSRNIVRRDLETENEHNNGTICNKKYQDEKRRISRQMKVYECMVKKIEDYKKRVKDGELDRKEKYNLIDPDSKVLRGENRKTFIQGYNARFTISNNDIILDYNGDTESEKNCTEEMITRIEDKKRELQVNGKTKYLMDSGFENMSAILDCQEKGIDVYIDMRKTSFSDEAQKRKFFKEVKKRDDEYYLSCIGNRISKGFVSKDIDKITFSFWRNGCKECANYKECYKRMKETTKSKTVTFDMLEIENRKDIDKYLKKLNSHKWKRIYNKRIGKEHVFANIKTQKGYHQTAYRGKEKVNMELGWISIAHNLMKYVNYQLSFR